MRSGENATDTSRPGRRPRSSSGCTSSSRVLPTYVVLVRTITWSRRACLTTVSHAARSMRRSGCWRSSTGVGTQIRTASAASSAPGLDVSWSSFSSSADCRDSLSPAARSTLPSRMSCSRRSLTSTPVTFTPPAASPIPVGNPTYPRPSTATVRVAAPVRTTSSGRAPGARASGVVTEPLPMAMWGQRLDGRRLTRTSVRRGLKSRRRRSADYRLPTTGCRARIVLRRYVPGAIWGSSQIRWSSRPSRQNPTPSPRTLATLMRRDTVIASPNHTSCGTPPST